MFSNQPDTKINYAWKGIGNKDGKWNKVWYIKKITKIRGNQGVLFGKPERFGMPGIMVIKHPYAKQIIINHARVKYYILASFSQGG